MLFLIFSVQLSARSIIILLVDADMKLYGLCL